MSGGAAIGLVSESLRDLLENELKVSPLVPVTVLGPDEPAGGRRVNLFLYKVAEHPFLRNQDWRVRPGAPDRLVPPPLSLTLGYLLTAYAPNDQHGGNSAAHQLLGAAMRVLHENPVVPLDHLATGLHEASEQIRVVPVPADTEEVSRIWGTFNQPYRPSVSYDVSVVQIDKLPAHERPAPPRVRKVGIPAVEGPFQPPVVAVMDPVSGAPGRDLRFAGEHVKGRPVTVTMGGATLLDAVEATGDTFTATVPGTLGAGVYPVVVDVAGMFRRAFLFEVTP
jgi:hypothetical protein